ncbi:MAG: hypothetical protein VB858_02385 [Planctomycetaceae bacterium]
MKTTLQLLAVACLIGGGYFLGTHHAFAPSTANAQGFGDPADNSGMDEIAIAIAEVSNALKKASDLLEQDGRHISASSVPNVSAILAGGVNALEDLETGRGVDPETFAALYAEQATDEIAAELDKDELGRLTYKGKVIRLYSISRLKNLYKMRSQYTDADAEPALSF